MIEKKENGACRTSHRASQRACFIFGPSAKSHWAQNKQKRIQNRAQFTARSGTEQIIWAYTGAQSDSNLLKFIGKNIELNYGTPSSSSSLEPSLTQNPLLNIGFSPGT